MGLCRKVDQYGVGFRLFGDRAKLSYLVVR
jgi:hypothetical protein